MLNILLLVVLAVSVGFFVPCDAQSVDCSAYGYGYVNCANLYPYSSFDIDAHASGYQECRTKWIDSHGNNDKRDGVILYTYADEGYNSNNPKETLKCESSDGAEKMLLISETPDISDLDSIKYSYKYKDCCAKKVIDRCFYKAELYIFCGSNYSPYKRIDNYIKKVRIYYRSDTETYANSGVKKQVTVELKSDWYDSNYFEIKCWNNWNAKVKWVKSKVVNEPYVSDKIKYYCGDSDLNVLIFKDWHYSEHGVILKVQRYECLSAYGSIIKDEKDALKFKIRHASDRYYGPGVDAYQGIEIAPVLAEIKKGECGPIVDDVNPKNYQS